LVEVKDYRRRDRRVGRHNLHPTTVFKGKFLTRGGEAL